MDSDRSGLTGEFSRCTRTWSPVDAEDGEGVCGLARHGGAPYCRLPPFDAGYCGKAPPVHPISDLEVAISITKRLCDRRFRPAARF
jgi:hypothetical protein